MNGFANLLVCQYYIIALGFVVIPQFIRGIQIPTSFTFHILDYPDKPGNDVASQIYLLGPYTDIFIVHCSREYIITASTNLKKNKNEKSKAVT